MEWGDTEEERERKTDRGDGREYRNLHGSSCADCVLILKEDRKC